MAAEFKPCWQVSYYFSIGHKKRLYQGKFCGCQPGDSRADAIQRVMPDLDPMEEGQKLVKVTARRSPERHYCFTNEAK